MPESCILFCTSEDSFATGRILDGCGGNLGVMEHCIGVLELLCDPYNAEKFWFWSGIEIVKSLPTFLMDNIWLFLYSLIQTLVWIGGFSLQVPSLGTFAGGAQEFWGSWLLLGPLALPWGCLRFWALVPAAWNRPWQCWLLIVRCVLPQSNWSFLHSLDLDGKI